jgi:hypothetical protein
MVAYIQKKLDSFEDFIFRITLNGNNLMNEHRPALWWLNHHLFVWALISVYPIIENFESTIYYTYSSNRNYP